MLGLRLGKDPRAIVTTTPKPTKLVKDLVAEPGTIVIMAPPLVRIVGAIDPAVSNTEGSNEHGIVFGGKGPGGEDAHYYILSDCSTHGSPSEWANVAIREFERLGADKLVAEVNQGGDMVESTVRNVAPNVPFKKVHASRGKVLRAEPVSALYEQGRVHHVGIFGDLEDQMCDFTADFDVATAGYSPDRVDALVYVVTELMTGGTFEWDLF